MATGVLGTADMSRRLIQASNPADTYSVVTVSFVTEEAQQQILD